MIRLPSAPGIAVDADVDVEKKKKGSSVVVVEHEELQIPEGWYDGWSIAITRTTAASM